MKVYFWMMIIMINAHASSNPFNLKESFEKLEAQQENLIEELTKSIEINSTKKITQPSTLKHQRESTSGMKKEQGEVLKESARVLKKNVLNIKKATPTTIVQRSVNEINDTQQKVSINLPEKERSKEASNSFVKEVNASTLLPLGQKKETNGTISNSSLSKNKQDKHQAVQKTHKTKSINIHQAYKDAVKEMSKGN